MIHFPRSSFTWKSHPHVPDPNYRWPGGFVGEPDQVYHVRFTLEARCQVTHLASGQSSEIFLGAPCRSEYTIARRNLFQVPSGEWRMAFSAHTSPILSNRPSHTDEEAIAQPLADRFADYTIDIRRHKKVEELTQVNEVVVATLANDELGACSYYQEEGFGVEVEFPINVMNLNQADGQFQICTGPILLPDLKTWTDGELGRAFVAHVALADFDHVEFILRRSVEAAPHERAWLDQPRGRDRLELLDPTQPPPGYPSQRSQPLVYNEVWERSARNTVLRADGF
ncbi:MAG: hypothetical protein GKR89_00785 [Candidatus Latescibacteria bacterium]|nr:hypothetical protein [Candidatus Latescibacterota bacterium]